MITPGQRQECGGLPTLLDEVEGIHMLSLPHNDLALWSAAGAQEDRQADELLSAQASKGLHALQHAQQPLQLLHLQASHLCTKQQSLRLMLLQGLCR